MYSCSTTLESKRDINAELLRLKRLDGKQTHLSLTVLLGPRSFDGSTLTLLEMCPSLADAKRHSSPPWFLSLLPTTWLGLLLPLQIFTLEFWRHVTTVILYGRRIPGVEREIIVNWRINSHFGMETYTACLFVQCKRKIVSLSSSRPAEIFHKQNDAKVLYFANRSSRKGQSRTTSYVRLQPGNNSQPPPSPTPTPPPTPRGVSWLNPQPPLKQVCID